MTRRQNQPAGGGASPHTGRPPEFSRRITKLRPTYGWILTIPSFWGALGWSIAVPLYIYGPIKWDPPQTNFYIVFFGIMVSFTLSFLMFFLITKNHIRNKIEIKSRNLYITRYGLHIIGLFGAFLFVYDLNNIGNFREGILFAYIYDPLAIRNINIQDIRRGNFINYVGWFAVFMSSIYISQNKEGRKIDIFFVVLQLAASLLFLNKSRFTMILLLAFFGFLVSKRKLRLKTTIFASIFLLAVMSFFFIAFSSSTGKVYDYGAELSPAIQTLLIYVTGGPAYLAHIISTESETGDFSFRTLGPFLTISAMLFDTKVPPSQIIEFLAIPFQINVGTALEPFFRDFGYIGLGIGIAFFSFGSDLISYIGYRTGGVAGNLLVSLMCASSFSSFFAPRFNTTAFFAGFVFFALVVSISTFRKVLAGAVINDRSRMR